MKRIGYLGVLFATYLVGCQSKETETKANRARPPSPSVAHSDPQATTPLLDAEHQLASDPIDDRPRLSPAASHRAMVDALTEIKARLPDENWYLGDLEARELRKHASALPSGMSDLDKAALFNQLGLAELRLGHEQQAIEGLTKALKLIGTAEGPPELLRDAHVHLAFELGVSHMRLAETENCCQRNTPDSCIVPIRGDGIHQSQDPARKAIAYFTDTLKNSAPQSATHLRARWLLNIASMTVGAYPDHVPKEYLIPSVAFESETSFPRFLNISSRLGIDTFSMCGGAVADDFDGDDLLDLFVSSWDPAGQLQFFHNNGDGTFEDRTTVSNLVGISGGLNLVQADYNNDGHVDLLVLRGAWFAGAGLHPNSLIHNNGDGTFMDVTLSAGLGDVHYPTQTASWADYDNDGDLDVFIGNEHGKGVTAPCQLFENKGEGTFEDVAPVAGVTNNRFAKSVMWGDFDNDRWPDLYISNQDQENRLYKNLGNGTFVDVAPQLGVTRPLSSFPAWFFDVDNDGVLDLFVSSYSNHVEHIAASYVERSLRFELAHLYKGTGEGAFVEVGEKWNLTRPATPMGSNFGDLNGDGFLDFYLGTGSPEYYNLMPNVMYLNRDGERFDDVTMAGGFGHLQKGHAVVFADLDNDGDQDVFEQLGGAFPGDKFFDALFENPGFKNHWLTIQLVGKQTNRSRSERGFASTLWKMVNLARFTNTSIREAVLAAIRCDRQWGWAKPNGSSALRSVGRQPAKHNPSKTCQWTWPFAFVKASPIFPRLIFRRSNFQPGDPPRKMRIDDAAVGFDVGSRSWPRIECVRLVLTLDDQQPSVRRHVADGLLLPTRPENRNLVNAGGFT